MNYPQARQIYENSRKRKLANNTYLEKNIDDSYAIRLHATQIIKFYPEKTVLDSGGYRTVTTKARINCFGFDSHDWLLTQTKGIWYLINPTKDSVIFADGITYADNKWTGQDENPKRIAKLRKQAKQYAKDFTEALFAGKVPKPPSSDCFYCSMQEVKTKRPLCKITKDKTHIVSHFDEKYYVPSLLVNATKMFPISRVAEDCIARLWSNKPVVDCFADISKTQIETAIKRYCYRQLQTA